MKYLIKNKDGSVSVMYLIDSNASIETEITKFSEDQKNNIQSYRLLNDLDIPKTREFRNAWCDETDLPTIDINLSKAKYTGLDRIRCERVEKFIELGFPYKINPDLEKNLVAQDVIDQLNRIRNITEPLKNLEVSGYNDVETLDTIKVLSDIDLILQYDLDRPNNNNEE